MPSLSLAVVFALAALAALAVVIALAVALHRERAGARDRIEALIAERSREVEDARRDSVQKSRSTLKGQIAEQMAPLLPGFRWAPSDARFIGDPIDYVVFDGYTGLRDARGGADDLEVVLLEVKQGGSALSPFQRAIARAVEEGRLRFEVLRISDQGELSTESWRPRRTGS